MVDNPMWEICERVAEVQALLDERLAPSLPHPRPNACRRQCDRALNPVLIT